MSPDKPLDLSDPALWPIAGHAGVIKDAGTKPAPATGAPIDHKQVPSLLDAALWSDEARARTKAQETSK